MADSETLRTALRDAEVAIIDAAKKTDHDAPDDKEPLKELQAAVAIVTKVRKQLEAGKWVGRNVAIYPQAVERLLDGAR